MSAKKTIEHKLSEAFSPIYCEVINESHMHNVPTGAESHFKVVLVSDEFEGLSLVKRHQRVYKVLAEELASGVHALALNTLTQAEWEVKNKQVPDSPPCMGGSKQTGM